jgi:putative hydrolase of the HAD superfamily
VPGAHALLAAMREAGLGIAVVTNNVTAEQAEKVRHCAFETLVDWLVTSEDVGASKPEPKIFEAALDRLGVEPGEAVMVGDAWGTDIAGARAAGIRAVWFNRQSVALPDPAVDELTTLEPTARAARVIIGAPDQSSAPAVPRARPAGARR